MALSVGSHDNRSTVTREDGGGYTLRSRHGTLQRYAAASSRNRERQRFGGDESSYSRKDENRRPKKYPSDYGSKRSIYGRRTPGESDWDDGRWEWEDAPRREDRGHSMSRRHHYPSPSPILRGASPESCLVSPWLGGNTSCSAGRDGGRWEWEDTPRREDRGHSMSRRHRYPSPSPILRGASPESCLVTPWLGGNAPRSAGRDGGRREFEGTPRREDRGDSVSRRRHSDSCQVGTSHQLSSSVASSTEGSEDGRITSFGDKNF